MSPEQVAYLVDRLDAAEAVIRAGLDPIEGAAFDECPLCHVKWGRMPHPSRSGCLYEKWCRFIAEETEVFSEWPMPTREEGVDEDEYVESDAKEGDAKDGGGPCDEWPAWVNSIVSGEADP